jgi:hypothetical protein
LFAGLGRYRILLMTTPLRRIWRWRQNLFYTQDHWNINKKHWQVAKLTNGARQVCVFYTPMIQGAEFILTPDFAL